MSRIGLIDYNLLVIDYIVGFETVATYPFAGERGEAHGCVFQRRKSAELPPTFICGKRQKNRRKLVIKNIPDSGVVFTFEEGISTSHVCPKGQQP